MPIKGKELFSVVDDFKNGYCKFVTGSDGKQYIIGKRGGNIIVQVREHI